MGRAEARLYNTAKRGDDKAKTHSAAAAGFGGRDGTGVGLRDARATGVFQNAELAARRRYVDRVTSGV
jgi:hypothetical protein